MEVLADEATLETEFSQLQAQEHNKQLRTFCEIGGIALTLEEFEASHPHIVLGYN